jgi:hypothetical protein
MESNERTRFIKMIGKEKGLDFYRLQIFYATGHVDELEIEYLRGYYIVCLGLIALIETDQFPFESGVDMLDGLLQMKVDAEIDPDDPDNEDTLEAIQMLKVEVTGFKQELANHFNISVEEHDNYLLDSVKKSFETYNLDGLTDSENSDLNEEQTEDEVDEEESDILVDPSLIQDEKIYDAIFSLLDKQKIKTDGSMQIGEDLLTQFSNEFYRIVLIHKLDDNVRRITISSPELGRTIVVRLSNIFDGSEKSEVAWEALDTFNISKSQVKSLHDKGIS